MKQAFLIVAHKNFNQLRRLIEYIADETHHVYVHIDKKNDQLHEQLVTAIGKNENVVILEQRTSIYWGGFSQVEATLNLLEIAGQQHNYDFYHLISGQDLLIKSKDEMDQFLELKKGHQFLEVLSSENHLWRIKGYYLCSNHKYSRSRPVYLVNNILSKLFQKYPLRSNLQGFELYKGANWFTLSGDCVAYLLSYLKENPKYITDYKHTICADEHFFQTLILNSPFKESVIQETLREIQWDGGANPKTYTVDDYELLNQSPALFARKFDESIDSIIIDKIYERVQ